MDGAPPMFSCAAPQTGSCTAGSPAGGVDVLVGAKPPWNQPQETFELFSRLPMFSPVNAASAPFEAWLLSEQSS